MIKKMTLPPIKAQKKNGSENFNSEDQTLNINLSDFWSWNQSNLIENRTRGILAEFIVKNALEIISDTRKEWDEYDLESNTGKKLEIKSAAYLQSWEQENYSKISFGIAPTYGTDNYDGTKKRWSDYYIFCLLKNKDQNTINPLDVSQWTFFVLSTEILNEQRPLQKTIGLNSLMKLEPIQCRYSELKKVIDK
ncbi:hypothetical protein N8203_03190 [Crocinitomicaceae bacterium]|nr:hypothetical protein [Crocinitomicaceae bacterium]